jgi:redox-sensitive bicupin YhaK (pirin superfamily)
MNRQKFFKNSILGLAGLSLLGSRFKSDIPAIGFNHLPLPDSFINTENIILHKAVSRGHANHGWLDSHHTFSFASYYNPERMQFGVLRVLNDDVVQAGMGFGTHPHENMEIISIPLSGDLEHKDSMGNLQVIREGDIQVMSAGTGIQHSEYNRNKDKSVNFLQIWIFPKQRGVKPRYDQITLDTEKMQNQFAQILSPFAEDDGVWIHQDAWFHRGKFTSGKTGTYQMKKGGNGLYIFMIEGKAEVKGQLLEKRDGMGITGEAGVSFEFTEPADVLLIEVPMS